MRSVRQSGCAVGFSNQRTEFDPRAEYKVLILLLVNDKAITLVIRQGKIEQVAELVDAPSIKLIGTKGSNISLIQHEVINHVVAKTSR